MVAEHCQAIGRTSNDPDLSILDQAGPYFDRVEDRSKAQPNWERALQTLHAPPDEQEAFTQLSKMKDSAGGADGMTAGMLLLPSPAVLRLLTSLRAHQEQTGSSRMM